MEEKLEDKTVYDYEDLSAEEVEVLVNQMCDDYNQGLVGYEDTINPLKDVQNLLAPDTKKGVIISNSIEWVEDMKTSKDHYNTGLNKMESDSVEDYLEAIHQFEQVIEEDSNYANAKVKVSEATELYYVGMVEKADSYCDDGKYLDAIHTYEELQDLYDDRDIDAKIQEVEEAYKKNYEEQAKAFINEKDYANGINRYKELSKYFESEYDSTIEDLEAEYMQYAISSSEALLSQGDIEGASDIIALAKSYFGSKTDLNLQMQRIESFIPVKLEEMEPIKTQETSSCTLSLWSTSDVDNMGNSDMTGLKAYNYASRHNNTIAAQYALDGQYDRLTGTFVLHEDSKNLSYDDETGEGSGSVLVIYGDTEIIYMSDVMTGGVRPIDVDIDISGVETLSINFRTQIPMIPILSTITVGFVNPELSKTYTPVE